MDSKKEKKVQPRAKAQYIDGFLIPIAKKNIPAYKRMSQKAGKIWMEYGALDYMECTGDDLDLKMPATFPKLLKLKPDETAVFSWISFKSRKHRDSVNAKVMKDPRLTQGMDVKKMPFDMKKLLVGGYKVIVNL